MQNLSVISGGRSSAVVLQCHCKQVGRATCGMDRCNPLFAFQDEDGAQRTQGPARCRAAAGVVNQAVTSRRTATSQHQGGTAPHFYTSQRSSEGPSTGTAREAQTC